jgi:hypothetical protein
MTINSLVIKITEPDGNYIEPVYECHSWDKAQEIIERTEELIAGSGNTMTFSVVGHR